MEALPVLVTERVSVFQKTLQMGISEMDLEAHVDPRIIFRTLTSLFAAHVFPKKFCITSTAHFHAGNTFVLSFVGNCSVSGEGMKEKSKKIPKCSSLWDLSIEFSNVEFRALAGPKLRLLWLLASSSLVFPRFLYFENRFWRRVWRRNSGKNSNCSSHWDLSIELS